MSILSDASGYVANTIEEEDAIAEQLERKGRKVIKLNRGDPALYFKTPKYMIDAYIRALKEGKTAYSNSIGAPELRKAIARRYKRRYRIDIDEDNVLVTQGISEALSFINGALINSGDNAVIFDPSYPPYLPYLRLYHGEEISGRYEERNKWNVDTDHLRKLLKEKRNRRIKYMLVTNPNNPTGTVFDRKILEEIVEIANENRILLVSDEIYDELVFRRAKFTSVCELAKGMPYILLNGASKCFNAPGFRMGFAILPEEDRRSKEVMGKLKDFAKVRLSPNTPAQYAFAEGMENVREHDREVKRLRDEVEKRTMFAAKLINESKYMHAVIPSGAFYVFPKLSRDLLKIRTDKEFVDELLKEECVQLTRGSGFRSEGHVRVVTLPTKDILGKAINRIEKFCKRHAK